VIDKRHIKELRERLAGYRRPMLSLYATVNPAHPDINPQAVYVKVKNTLKQLGEVSPKVIEQVRDYFEGRSHDSRSLAVFADENHFETLELEVELLDDGDDHLEARWGEPYLTPLLMAMDHHDRYGVAFVDRDHLRFFQVQMGQIEELLTEARPQLADEEDDQIQSNRQARPEYVASRGGAEVQLAQEHVKDHQRTFYKDMGVRLREIMNANEIQKLVVMGPDGDTHGLRDALPPQLADRVASVVPGPSSPKASAHEILERVRPTLQELGARARAELLDQIRERGVWGLDACLHALQEGRLHIVAVPEALHQQVYMETGSSYVSIDEDECKKRVNNGGRVEKIDLADKLPELAETWGARIEFIGGAAEDRLVQEFGGMAGLKRW
jgi:peptide subunit release factor 1 (eRF1)